jgi:hypothetical protein
MLVFVRDDSGAVVTVLVLVSCLSISEMRDAGEAKPQKAAKMHKQRGSSTVVLYSTVLYTHIS